MYCNRHYHKLPNNGKCILCKKEKDFIETCKKVHNNKYNYDNVIYFNKDYKVRINCPNHGDFLQIANSHKRGINCSKCAKDYVDSLQVQNRLTTTQFIERAKAINGDRYNYSKTNYVKGDVKVLITCKNHGDFLQAPFHHLNNIHCPTCALVTNRRLRADSEESFIKKSKAIFKKEIDYSKISYSKNKKEVKLWCIDHGEFSVNKHNHLKGSKGCNECIKHSVSKSERDISKILKHLGYRVLNNTRNVIEPYELDIYIPELNKAIEFNGLYWHYDKSKFRKGYHAMKSNMCREKGIKLLHVREELWLKDKEKMLNVIKEFLNK